MKRFTEITKNPGSIWSYKFIDSPMTSNGRYVFDNKENYFVRGRPTVELAETFKAQIRLMSK